MSSTQMTETDSFLDSVLDLEDQSYAKGFKEGQEAGKKQGFIEGRELGVQTGFQRYISMGVLQSRYEAWQSQDPNPKIQKQLEALGSYLQLDEMSNAPSVVENIDRSIKLAKNKARVIAATTKSPKIALYDSKIAFVANDDAIEDLG